MYISLQEKMLIYAREVENSGFYIFYILKESLWEVLFELTVGDWHTSLTSISLKFRVIHQKIIKDLLKNSILKVKKLLHLVPLS